MSPLTEGPQDFTPETIRRLWVNFDDDDRTHWDHCWKVHHECLTERLLQRLEEVTKERDQQERFKWTANQRADDTREPFGITLRCGCVVTVEGRTIQTVETCPWVNGEHDPASLGVTP